MLVTLTRDIIVNTGTGGKPRKAGEGVEIPDRDAAQLIVYGSAIAFVSTKKPA